MARVTVEDCIEVINNRFELVLMAAQRARDISAGQVPLVSRDNDKNPVIALREIAEQRVDMNELKRHIVRGVNRYSDKTEEDELLSALQAQETLPGLPGVEASENLSGFEISEIDFESTEAAVSDEDISDDELAADADLDTDLAADEEFEEEKSGASL